MKAAKDSAAYSLSPKPKEKALGPMAGGFNLLAGNLFDFESLAGLFSAAAM
jgi:hypothetical protein